MKKLTICLVLLLFCSSLTLYAQTPTATVTGTIYNDNTKETIPNANIIIKDTQRGTTSDINGYYELNIPAEKAIVLEYRFTGMEVLTIKVGPLNTGQSLQQEINLKEGSTMLDAAVVTAGKHEQPLKKTNDFY